MKEDKRSVSKSKEIIGDALKEIKKKFKNAVPSDARPIKDVTSKTEKKKNRSGKK